MVGVLLVRLVVIRGLRDPRAVPQHIRLRQHGFLAAGAPAPGRVRARGRKAGICCRGVALEDSRYLAGVEGVLQLLDALQMMFMKWL